MAINRFAISGCNCSTPTGDAVITGVVHGCALGTIAGITVEAHDNTSGGTLLDSTTTDGSGNFTLNPVGAVSGNDIVVLIPATGRYAATAYALAWIASGADAFDWAFGETSSGVDVQATAAATYVCFSSTCTVPTKKTLNISSTGGASAVLHYTGFGTWNDTFPAGGANVILGSNRLLSLAANWSHGGCASDVGLAPTSTVCPPSLLLTYSVCGGTDTVTVTE